MMIMHLQSVIVNRVICYKILVRFANIYNILQSVLKISNYYHLLCMYSRNIDFWQSFCQKVKLIDAECAEWRKDFVNRCSKSANCRYTIDTAIAGIMVAQHVKYMVG